MDAMRVGKFIYELRKERGLKQKELAETLSVSDKAISRWETGKGIPDIVSLENLSEFFEVTINELLVGERVGEKNMGEVADENIKLFVKKEKSMRRKLIATIGLWVVLIILFIFFVFPRRSSRMEVGISDDNVWKVFDYVEDLEEQGTEYSVTVDTKGRRFVIVMEKEEWMVE